jgi:uracil-DNA glycosylase
MEQTQSVELTWRDVLADEKAKPYFRELLDFVAGERARGAVVYPPNEEVFAALAATKLSDVRVVILGQDPYHGPGQAHGLCFSVQKGVRPPPSLKNIFLELKADIGVLPPDHGCLTAWAERGVLLLNSVLTVEQGQPSSHADRGWERFTDAVISAVNRECSGVVFMLWGSYAQKKGAVIDPQHHLVLKAPHPSPFSAHSGFLGCKHFSKANTYLGPRAIDWQL